MKRTDQTRFRRHWQDLGWETRASAVIIAMSGLALAGFLAVSLGSPGAGPAGGQRYIPLTTTVTKLVRFRRNGAVVVKRVPVVGRMDVTAVTVDETRTVQTPGGTEIVTRPVVRYRTIYRERVVTVNGKAVTVSQVATNTQMLTVTNERTSTIVQHDTLLQTTPPETVVVTTPGATVTKTVTTTVPLVTVTVPVVITITTT